MEEKEYSGGGGKSNDKLAFLWMIPTVLVGKRLAQWDAEQEIGKASTWTILEGGRNNIAPFSWGLIR